MAGESGTSQIRASIINVWEHVDFSLSEKWPERQIFSFITKVPSPSLESMLYVTYDMV